MSYPQLPAHILKALPIDQSEAELVLPELWSEVCIELTDPDYSNRQHPNLGTYNAGCRGPACRKAMRDRSWERTRTESRAKNPQLTKRRRYDAVIVFFVEFAKERIAEEEAKMKAALQVISS